MATDPKRERLRSLSLFSGADDKALDHLESAADEVTVKAGHTLISQGARHHEIFVLQSGAASVLVDDTVVADIPAGEFVGELSFFNQATSSATVKTTEESMILVIPYNRFDQILDDNPQLVRAIARELAERLQATDFKLKQQDS